MTEKEIVIQSLIEQRKIVLDKILRLNTGYQHYEKALACYREQQEIIDKQLKHFTEQEND